MNWDQIENKWAEMTRRVQTQWLHQPAKTTLPKLPTLPPTHVDPSTPKADRSASGASSAE